MFSVVKSSFEAVGGEGHLQELGFGGHRAQGGCVIPLPEASIVPRG